MLLGNIKLNLAEYVDRSDDEEGITRRYLMQDSKINSTLKIGIMMHQVEGDRNFVTYVDPENPRKILICCRPPLRTAMVFDGIAGIMSAEQGDPDDSGRVPLINNRSRETGDLQDMYRRTLAASWACRAGELPPDCLIEDIFAGGDGWEMGSPGTRLGADDYEDTTSLSDADSRRTVQGTRLSPALSKRPKAPFGHHSRTHSKSTDYSSSSSAVSGKKSIEHQGYSGYKKKGQGNGEVSEFEVREDLKSWEISVPQ
jgi:hypothetical protein